MVLSRWRQGLLGKGSLSEAPSGQLAPHPWPSPWIWDVCVVLEQLLDQGSFQASWPHVPAPRAQEALGEEAGASVQTLATVPAPCPPCEIEGLVCSVWTLYPSLGTPLFPLILALLFPLRPSKPGPVPSPDPSQPHCSLYPQPSSLLTIPQPQGTSHITIIHYQLICLPGSSQLLLTEPTLSRAQRAATTSPQPIL